MHRDGIYIWNGIALEGVTVLMVDGNSMDTNRKGHYTTSLLDVCARGKIARADDLSETVKLTVIGHYMQGHYHGRYYAKAQNLARKPAGAYGTALSSYDLLLMLPLSMKATHLPAPDAPREKVLQRALEMIYNTCPFDVIVYPAMTVPCALSENLPVGMMLVGRKWSETTLLRAARIFEAMETYSAVRPEGVKSAG